MSSEDALKIVEAGCKIVAEGANMPSDPEAIKIYHEKGIEFGPAKVPKRQALPSCVLSLPSCALSAGTMCSQMRQASPQTLPALDDVYEVYQSSAVPMLHSLTTYPTCQQPANAAQPDHRVPCKRRRPTRAAWR